MDDLAALDDRVLDELLSGSPLDEELEPLADLVRRLRASAALEPVPPMSLALRAQLHRVHRPRPRPARAARTALLRGVAVAAAAAVVAVLAAGATQNRLPSDFQDAVSSTAQLVGVDLPSSHDHPTEQPGSAPTPSDVPDLADRALDGSRPAGDGSTAGGFDSVDDLPSPPAAPAAPPAPLDGDGAQDGADDPVGAPRTSGPSAAGGASNAPAPGGADEPSEGDEERDAGSGASTTVPRTEGAPRERSTPPR